MRKSVLVVRLHMCLLVFALIPFSLYASGPTLQNLNAGQIQSVLKDFATATFPAHATAAGSYGTIFGFEVGLIGGIADSPGIASLSTSEKVDSLPKAAFLAAATAPFGLGAELAILPVKVGDFEYDYYSLGLRWTFTDLIKVVPFDIKFRIQYTDSSISYKQTISGVDTVATYDGKTTAYSLTFGKRILIVEPYAGFGVINGKHSLKATGSATFFDSTVTDSQREKQKLDDTYYFVGADVHLLIFTVGAEMTKVYDNTIVMGKLALGF